MFHELQLDVVNPSHHVTIQDQDQDHDHSDHDVEVTDTTNNISESDEIEIMPSFDNTIHNQYQSKLSPPADVPVGLLDNNPVNNDGSHQLNYYDYDDQIKKCYKKLKSIQMNEILLIIGESNAVGTGKNMFLTNLLKKYEVRNLYQGGIFYINPGEISSEIEYTSLIRKLIEDLITYSLKYSTITNIQSQKWLHYIRPSYGDVKLEDCLFCLREIIEIITSSNVSSSSSFSSSSPYSSAHSPSFSSSASTSASSTHHQHHHHRHLEHSRSIQTKKVLLVFHDLRNEYLLRLLRGCGVTFLVTTRYPDLFSDGHVLFQLKFCPANLRLKIFPSNQNEHSLSIFSSSISSTTTTKLNSNTETLLNELFETCSTWGEVDLLARYLYSQGGTGGNLSGGHFDYSLIQSILIQRKNDLIPGSLSTKWITDYTDVSWKSISIHQHLGSFTTYLLLYNTLNQSMKLKYLSFSLLPSGVVFPLQFIMMLWGIKIQQECIEILSHLCRKGLLFSLTVDGVVLYTLSPLHSHLLILLVLREKQIDIDDCSFLSSFMMCTMLLTPSTPQSDRLTTTIQSHLNTTLTNLLKYLTDKKKFSSLPNYRLTKYLVYWRRLYLCFHAGILPSFRGAVQSFHEVIDHNSNSHRNDISMFDLIYAATSIIENLDLETEIKIKNWLLKGIDILAYVEASQHHGSNHSTSTINAFNQFKIAELRNKLGILYRHEGQFKEALDQHISALSTFQSSRHSSGSPYHNEIAKTFLLISDVYIAEGAYDDAINVIQSVIQFQQGITSPSSSISSTISSKSITPNSSSSITSSSSPSSSHTNSLSQAEMWMSLGELYCYQHKYQETIQCYKTAIGIYHKCVGIHHPDAVLAEGLMGIVLLKWSHHLLVFNHGVKYVTSPLTELLEQESDQCSYEASLPSTETSTPNEELMNQCKLKREEGIELASNAIAWFIRRGYLLSSSKLNKLITSLPVEERVLFKNIEGINSSELESSLMTNGGNDSICSTASPPSLSSLSVTTNICGYSL